jgi:putative Flp pilus-assembly TadE/G-like protein
MLGSVHRVATTGKHFCQDEAGNYVITMALLMPVFVGLCALGVEFGWWMHQKDKMQNAADSGAVSAATANSGNLSNLETEADAVIASYGFVNGSKGTVITVNRPPTSGSYGSTSNAVEVIIQQPQDRLFSRIYSKGQVNIAARAVALPTPGLGCVLALNQSASGAATIKGSALVNLNECGLYSNSSAGDSVSAGGSSSLKTQSVHSAGGVTGQSNISAQQGIFQNQSPSSDPYASMNPGSPSGCTKTNLSVKNKMTISAGTYCGGIQVNAGAVLTLNPGIYFITNGDFQVNGGATVTGTGVTLVFTSTAKATINGGADVSLTAPTSGSTAGVVMFGARDMATGTNFNLNGGSTQYFGGAIYLPKAALNFAGGAGSTTSCTQIVADTVTFTGNANLSLNCTGSGIKPIGSGAATLVE